MQALVSGSMACLPSSQGAVPLIIKHRQHCNVQPGANACWALASEMDTILTALRETQSAAI